VEGTPPGSLLQLMSAAVQRQRSGAAAKRTVPAQNKDDPLRKVADWLRDAKRSGVTTREAVQYDRRVDYFKGTKLLEALTSAKFKQQKGFPKAATKEQAVALANQLMRAQYFHRSQRVFISARRWELEINHGTFEEDGLYTWIHEGSQTRLYVLCGLTLAGALMLCMIQIWPIWMKIGLWWCSVTFLTTFSALCIVRLLLFCLMFAVGFRGIWLFPNLFDDNQTFAGSFMPIMGRAEPVVVADEYDSDDDELRRIRKKKTDEEPNKEGAKRAQDQEPAFQFGLINAIVLFGVGLIACWNMGFFDGDNVPDFVARHEDLTFYFPTLAPPENTTEVKLDADGNPIEEEGEPADPFAAPADENERY